MSVEKFFILPEGAPGTFEQDEKLPKLPLNPLEETLKRYERNLLPFASKQELENSRRIIEEFKNGIGKTLHKYLEEKAAKERNWVSESTIATFTCVARNLNFDNSRKVAWTLGRLAVHHISA